MSEVRISAVGDAAAIVVLGDTVDPDTLRRVWTLSALVSERLGESALDVVPAYASVLVRFDPATIALGLVMACLRGAAHDSGDAVVLVPRRISVGVCFGDDNGADLEETAHVVGLTPQQYVKAFCAAQYRVAFLGFLAGFPYLMGLPTALAHERRPAPRDRVPQGSVAIASEQCGIYPRSSPGGWRLLGQTNAVIFDALREPPALFAPGDHVRFEPVKRLDRAVAEVGWS